MINSWGGFMKVSFKSLNGQKASIEIDPARTTVGKVKEELSKATHQTVQKLMMNQKTIAAEDSAIFGKAVKEITGEELNAKSVLQMLLAKS